MNERGYEEFLRGAIEEDDPLQDGLRIHWDFVEKIKELLPMDKAIEISREIDVLIGSIIVQHLEAAQLHPADVPEVVELVRQKTIEKLNEMGGE